MEYLTKNELVLVNQRVIANAGEGTVSVQYPAGLDIVVQQPQMVLFGKELYPSIWLKAAYILQKITKKHIFADGNKRTAYICTKLFLMKNGYHLSITKDEGVALMLGVTTSEDSEEVMLQVATFLKEHCQKLADD